MDITDIPIALICDQYNGYLKLMEELNLDVAGDYIYKAAMLIHIKSKMLLPRPPRPRASPEDPRQELVDRLLEYQRFKEVAESFAELDGMRMGIWTRRPQPLPTSPKRRRRRSTSARSRCSISSAPSRRRSCATTREHPPPLQLSLEDYSVRGQFDRLMGISTPGIRTT